MITLKIKNYKLIKDKEVDFDFGRLYLISGKNNIGKTTIKNAFESMLTALDSTPNPITTGETEGEIELSGFTGPNNEIITIHRKIEDSKSNFYMKRDGKIVKSVGEIRSFFQYTPFTVEEFVQLSTHAEGIRKQKAIILNLLSNDDKAKFINIEKEEASLVENRKITKKSLDLAVKMKHANSLTDTDNEILKNKDNIHRVLSELEEQLKGIETNKSNKNLLINNKEVFTNSINNAIKYSIINIAESTLTEFSKVIELIKKDYDQQIESITVLNDDDVIKIKERISNGKLTKGKLDIVLDKSSKSQAYISNVEKLSLELDKLETDLNNCRLGKSTFMKDIDLPIKNLIIGNDEEGLSYNLNGVVYPFNEKQLSKSLIYKITIELMMHINKQNKILVIGDTTDLDTESKQIIANYAIENDLLIIGDSVTDDPNLNIIIFGEDLNTSKTTTKKEITKVETTTTEIEQHETEQKEFLF